MTAPVLTDTETTVTVTRIFDLNGMTVANTVHRRPIAGTRLALTYKVRDEQTTWTARVCGHFVKNDETPSKQAAEFNVLQSTAMGDERYAWLADLARRYAPQFTVDEFDTLTR